MSKGSKGKDKKVHHNKYEGFSKAAARLTEYEAQERRRSLAKDSQNRPGNTDTNPFFYLCPITRRHKSRKGVRGCPKYSKSGRCGHPQNKEGLCGAVL
jgi:hypothetical protein